MPNLGRIDASFSSTERNRVEVTCWHPDLVGGFTVLPERPTLAYVTRRSSIGPWATRGSDCGSIDLHTTVTEWWFV